MNNRNFYEAVLRDAVSLFEDADLMHKKADIKKTRIYHRLIRTLGCDKLPEPDDPQKHLREAARLAELLREHVKDYEYYVNEFLKKLYSLINQEDI